MPRDDFKKPVRDALAARAGNHCSYPGCDTITIGPSEESDTATANTGVAAHISGASPGPGSRRYDPHMSAEERRSIDNGIWCCRDHGTLIDTDEVTYTREMLRTWRKIAEKKAQLRQAYGNIDLSNAQSLQDIGLANNSLSLIDGRFPNDEIGNAVKYACVASIWGNAVEHALRDFLIEYSKNAFDHGNATNLYIIFEKQRIVIRDNGNQFVPDILADPKSSRGGGLAYRALLSVVRLAAISEKWKKVQAILSYSSCPQ